MKHTAKQTLNGRYTYRSFRHEPIAVKDGKVEGDPQLAIPWAPPGILEIKTDPEGNVHGTLTFAPGVVLTVEGHILPATDSQPASLEVTGEGLSSVNKLKGFFIPESDHVVGTIMCLANDLARQPVGTAGPFILTPIKD